ncbi:hypothetical protein [Lacihabitans soyangensis]|uniref:Uncharacterized protein n=1 Tax=Lacihabitans soyangensis TaxID=869394 RepID=A0AAE3KUI1_9BACT|nr:hypothetical protein [Lacihabitans soyangensis]MCP9765592.1 hypothetical protein [Lacihabitans soyangensis]
MIFVIKKFWKEKGNLNTFRITFNPTLSNHYLLLEQGIASKLKYKMHDIGINLKGANSEQRSFFLLLFVGEN